MYAEAQGIMTEADYPYTALDGNCTYDKDKVTVSTTGYTTVIANGTNGTEVNNLKKALNDGPVTVDIQANKFVFQFYSGGILNTPECGIELDHAVVAVGYGADKNGNEYYIVRNSWGPSWGLGGYIHIAIVPGPGICGVQLHVVSPNV